MVQKSHRNMGMSSDSSRVGERTSMHDINSMYKYYGSSNDAQGASQGMSSANKIKYRLKRSANREGSNNVRDACQKLQIRNREIS